MPVKRIHVLLIEDNPGDVRFMQELLAEEDDTPFSLQCADRLASGLERLKKGGVDVVLLDLSLPDGAGLDTFVRAHGAAPDVPIVVMTGLDDETLAVRAVHEGAQDYLVKGNVDSNLMSRALRYAIERQRMLVELEQYTQELQAREESLRKLSRAVEQSPTVVMITDTQSRIEYVNPKFTQITGYTAQEVIGKTPKFLQSGETPPAEYQRLWKTIRAGGEWRGEFHNRKKSGELYWESASISSIKDSEGLITHFLAVKEDITPRKLAEEELERTRARLAIAERLETAGMVVGQIAHDFNNLLTPLLAYPEFIKQELSEGSKSREDLDMIARTAQQMADINQQLLALSRRGHVQHRVLNVNDVIRDVIVLLNKAVVPEGLFIKTMLADDLMNMKGAAEQLVRVVENLCQNAIEAMGDTGTLTIVTENVYLDQPFGNYASVNKGEYIKVTITDTGCGIPKDNMLKVFDPFFTTKKATKQRGSGLGLSVVYGIVTDHDGYIDLESEVDSGSTFVLYFPVCREDIEADASLSLGEVPRGTERILIVDDDPLQIEVNTRVLSSLGYRVDGVGSGEEAVEFLKREKVDLIVLDMIMDSGIDGAETYRRIQQFSPNQRAVIVSGYAESEKVDLAQNLGAGAYIRKPVTREKLGRAVRLELDKK
ncbi:MAG: response regulator [Kiritimatiellae bacterium]|nr:response regulator [Kiritimatiellia bacterium]